MENNLDHLLELATKDPAARPQFYKTLLSSDIYVLGKIKNPENEHPSEESGSFSLQPGDEIAFLFWTKKDGCQFLPIFSSLTVLQSIVDPNEKYLKLPCKDLFEMVRDVNIILNPSAPYGREFLPNEIANLLASQTAQSSQEIKIEEETTIQIGQPADYPTELLEYLRNTLPNYSDVKSAYLALYLNSTIDKNPHLLIAFDIEGGRPVYEKIRNDLGTIVCEAFPDKGPIDFILLENSLDLKSGDSIFAYFSSQTPFYNIKT